MKPTTLNSFLIAMKTELKEAEGKHPKFCDDICDGKIDFGGFAEYSFFSARTLHSSILTMRLSLFAVLK